MALSLLVNIGVTQSKDSLGHIEFSSKNIKEDDRDASKEVVVDEEPQERNAREIRIILTNPDDVYSQIWQAAQKHSTLEVVKLKILPSEIASKTDRTWVRSGGKLSFECNWIQDRQYRRNEPKSYLNFPRETSNKRRIFKGFYEYDIAVAIERMEMNDDLMVEIEREFRILRELEIHENFIRYFTFETDERNDFVYIATELCLGSVADLFHPINKQIPTEDVLTSLTPKGILFQATRGLDYLHQNNFVHRNVKPSSFLIKSIQTRDGLVGYAVKITDFRLSRQLDPTKDSSGTVASEGWEAPESRRPKQKLRKSLDVFILGCFYHYVLSGITEGKNPKHPFGDQEMTRLANIPDSKNIVYKKNWKPTNLNNDKAADLIKKMIRFDEQDRPTLSQVIEDVYFRPSTKDYYPIYEYPCPGLCVIFNQEHFTRLSRRMGSDKDWRRLKLTYEKLGFQVIVHHNLFSFDIKGELKKLAAQNFSKHGCLIVCLLSHGIENAIAGSDDQWVNINKLKYKFSYNKCPSLYGKPKIFIVQACQGSLEQTTTGVVPLTISGSGDMSHESNKQSTVQLSAESAGIKYVANCFKEVLNLKDAAPNRNPPILDFITITGTIPGFVSLRNSVTGTYFIQGLCQKLEEEYLTVGMEDAARDLEEILRGENGVQSYINSKIQNNNYRQTVSWETYLSKFIRFRKTAGIEEDDEEDANDGSSVHHFNQKYSFVVRDGTSSVLHPETRI